MNVINKFLIPALALGMFAACSDDNKFEGPETPDNESSVTMSISVQLPTAGSRADGDPINKGNDEAGSEDECKVNSMLIVLADATDNSFIDYAAATFNATNNSILKYDATFSISTLQNYLKDITTPKVNVFAFCNYSSEFASYLSTLTKNGGNTEWFNQSATVNSGAADITGKWNTSVKASIPMANSEIFEFTFTPNDDLTKYTKENPLKISTESNPIKVERSIARFDFKDASANKDFTYTIYTDEKYPNNKINVVIDRIGLVNMSNQYYYLRHNAPNKESSTTVADLSKTTILDASMPWVIDVDASTKAAYTAGVSTTDFLFPVTGSNGALGRNQWYSTPMSYFSSAKEDNETWTQEADYKVWRYVTENTIPDASRQQNGQSTGIVFKAKLAFTGTTDGVVGSMKSAHDATDNTKAIYFFKSDKVVPLGTADFILQDNNGLASSYVEAFKTAVGEGSATDATVKAKLIEAGFIIFEPATAGTTAIGTDDKAGEYYMYYYYWNRHNDNGKLNVMDAMEFGVVRNHIYKLKITTIKGLGHPRKPENDPDPEKPEKPDEEGNVAIEVAVQPVNWSVRVNGIEF